jgi:hypothetical protein
MAGQHASLTEERWSAFSLDQQVLMIGNEMNRARKLMAPEDRQRLQYCYERVLRLVDLTIRVHQRPTLWRELLRWRDLIAELYIAAESRPQDHDAAFRCLLTFTPVAYQQISLLFGGRSRSAA